MEIQQWVRKARKAAGLSGAELGAKLALQLRTERGHSKANISHWELGRHQPSTRQLVAISKITGVPLPNSITNGIATQADGAPEIPSELMVEEAELYLHSSHVIGTSPSARANLQWVSEQEEHLLTMFRCTDDEGRQAMLNHADSMPITLVAGVASNKS